MEPVDEASLEWNETERGPTHFRRKRLADAAGGCDLGASLYELPPGGKSWPYHYHTGNEEAIYVLAGEGTLRVGGEREGGGSNGDGNGSGNGAGDGAEGGNGDSDEHEDDGEAERYPLTAGDYVAFPAGPAGAHRVENDGDRPLRFLALSTMRDPDVTVYPDSDKIGVYAGAPPGGDPSDRVVDGYYPRDATVDYWLDEE
jgi:uncharacterized cupin superfamily protein